MKSSVHKSATLKSEEFCKAMKWKQKSVSEQLILLLLHKYSVIGRNYTQ